VALKLLPKLLEKLEFCEEISIKIEGQDSFNSFAGSVIKEYQVLGMDNLFYSIKPHQTLRLAYGS